MNVQVHAARIRHGIPTILSKLIVRITGGAVHRLDQIEAGPLPFPQVLADLLRGKQGWSHVLFTRVAHTRGAHSVAMTCAQMPIMPKTNATDARAAASSTIARIMSFSLHNKNRRGT